MLFIRNSISHDHVSSANDHASLGVFIMAIKLTKLGTEPADMSPYDSGLGLDKPYDPEFTFSKVTQKGDLLIHTQRLCGLAHSDIDRIEKISLVIPTWNTQHSFGPSLRPALVEEGGVTVTGVPSGGCVIVGDKVGGPARGRDVAKVFYVRNAHPNGQHALVSVEPGTLFAVAYRRDFDQRVVLVYRVDGAVAPGSIITDQIPKGRNSRPSSRIPSAINASLVSVRIYARNAVPRGWNRPEDQNWSGIEPTYLINAALTKLSGECHRAICIENFYEARNLSQKQKKDFDTPSDIGTDVFPVPSEEFYNKLCDEVASYRRILHEADTGRAHYALPLRTYLRFNETNPNAIDLHAVMPRMISNENPKTYINTVDIRTTLEGEIPEPLIYDNDMIMGACTYDELAERLQTEIDRVNDPEINTCSVALYTHAG